jgi:hypothetical protein
VTVIVPIADAVCNNLSEAQPKVTLRERHNGVDCECCIKLQEKLNEVLLELSSAKKIVQILYEDVQYGNLHQSFINGQQNSEGMLVREANSNTTWKQIPLALKKFNNKPLKQQQEFIPVLTNRYAVLDNQKSDDIQKQFRDQHYKTELNTHSHYKRKKKT